MSKRTAAGLAALFLLILPGGFASATPDLAVSNFLIDPASPYAGMAVRLEAEIENTGTDDAEGQIFVRFAIDGRRLEDVSMGSGLRSGERRVVSAVWVAEEGAHTLSAEADRPFDRVDELDEANNGSSLDVEVPFPSDVFDLTQGATIAIAAFGDLTSSGLVGLGTGLSDKLDDRLSIAGVRTVSRFELEEALRVQGLSPYSVEDLTTAARSMGADFVLTGDVVRIDLDESAISLGVLSIGTASAEVHVVATLFGVANRDPAADFAATGFHESTTEVTFDLTPLRSLPLGQDPCSGGLQSDRDAYYAGESVLIGFRNPAPDAWYSLEIYASNGSFLQWLGWQFIPMGECGKWVWNQRDTFGTQVPPSIYVARISDGTTQLGSMIFEIRPGSNLFPLADGITVGSAGFEASVAGEALNQSVDRLTADLIPALAGAASGQPEMAFGAYTEGESMSLPEAQIAAILPDGRVVINIGASTGVSRGAFFHVIDEGSGAVRGEIVVVEVRDAVSYAVRSTDFEPHIGDLVRPSLP